MSSIGNTVNNIEITFYGDTWLSNLPGDHFVIYINVTPVCCIPETL